MTNAKYRAFFNGKTLDLEAPSLYAAKQQAVAAFKPRKSQLGLVAVVLVERADGTPVTVNVD